MAFKRFTRFVTSYVLVGVIVAITVVWLAPELLGGRPAGPTAISGEDAARADPRPSSADGQRFSYADAVEVAAPSVVNIYTASRNPDPRNVFLDSPALDELLGGMTAQEQERLDTSLGSGLLVNAAGQLLTNHHVIRGAARIQVMLADGRNAPARVIGTDPESDLAVLQVNADNLPHVPLADGRENRVGDVVFAIGNPFGVGQTVTQGIISALGRSEVGLTTFENFIQTDAAINPGNSGGALINARGEVIGINTAIFSDSGSSTGIGFAIPADLAQAVLTDIVENGRVIRGWIGAQILPNQGRSGLRIAAVLPGGPADRAGLASGDVIESANGEPVRTVQGLLSWITEQAPGREVILNGRRDGETRRWEVEIAERPTDLNGDAPQRPPQPEGQSR
ncbi:trypsin-like peptidase domain-containing protein [Spiribacter sp. 1M153]|uniref:S1C family serine protease n=1 Tax=Spiribacter roseus TaxID=1855875 RepID=UPI00349F0968